MSCARVVSELQRSPLLSVEDASVPGALPKRHGFYAWWATPGALDVPPTRHPTEDLILLYVGIAPSRDTSKATLATRLLRQHIRGNVDASTFRFGLASLLWERKAWTPFLSPSGRFRLRENDALSAWQREHLRLQTAIQDQPWDLECDVVRAMRPPMNREHNADHPFYDRMGAARAAFRDKARVP